MGYILNTFDKLKELINDKTVNERFKLTAIIVHDPKDRNFKKHISDHFIDFARITGERFLFITFIQPSKEYADALRLGEYKYAKSLVSDSKQQRDTDTVINPFVRSHFNIPDNGSYLVVAKKLSDKEVFIVPTTTGSIPYQLFDLTSYCNDHLNFDELINRLKGESINIKEMIGESLLKIVSLFSPSEDGLNASSQCEIAKNTIDEEKQKLKNALEQSLDGDDLTNKVIEIYDIIDCAYRNVLNEGQHASDYEICDNYKLLDFQSQKFWDTYSRLSKFIKSESREELDYSAFILYLGKIIETELNLSVCQMLRQSMGIEMPTFYNKYCERADRVIIPTQRQGVNLNEGFYDRRKHRKCLKGVTLGDLLYAYKTAVGKEESSYANWRCLNRERLRELSDEFLESWEEIVKERNKAAHTRLVNDGSYKKTEKNFKKFQEEFTSTLYDIKCDLKGR